MKVFMIYQHSNGLMVFLIIYLTLIENLNRFDEGILSTIFRKFASDEKQDEKWILLDGPVDTLWLILSYINFVGNIILNLLRIESMNSVMDDNKILTLING